MLGQTLDIEIRCQFYTYNNNYNCNGSLLVTQSELHNVTFVLNHLPRRTNNNVVGLIFYQYSLEFLLTEAFTTFTNLQVLQTRGGLSEILDNTFKDAENLETLYIYESGFKLLPPFAFNGTKKLTSIHIYDCNVEVIDENAFAGMDMLSYLMISKSKLRSLPPNVLRPLTSLRSIMFQDASIETIPSRLFSNNNMLEHILLDNNRITAISRNFVDHLRPRLQWLFLSNNICTNTTINWFEKLQLKWTEIDSALEPCYRNYESTEDVCRQYCSMSTPCNNN